MYGTKMASAYDAGRSYAASLVKQALMKEVDEGLGHMVGGVASGAGQILQGAGHIGKGVENFVGHHVDHETAGRLAGLAGLGVGAAALTNAYRDAQQPYPQQGYYPAPF